MVNLSPFLWGLDRVVGSYDGHALIHALFDRIFWRSRFLVFVTRIDRPVSFI
jgi:hypothetical protein